MEKYKALLGKNINLELAGEIINSYKIDMIADKPHHTEGLGDVYKCAVTWTNKKLADNNDRMDFDPKTLDDLLNNKKAINPVWPAICFRVTE